MRKVALFYRSLHNNTRVSITSVYFVRNDKMVAFRTSAISANIYFFLGTVWRKTKKTKQKPLFACYGINVSLQNGRSTHKNLRKSSNFGE